MISENDLPELQDKQYNCIKRYLSNGFNKTEAYRYAYDTERMKTSSISVEASRFFKNPKVSLWLEYYRQNQQEAVKEELKYTAMDFIEECEELKLISLECRDKYGNPNVACAIKATENKAKVCGLLKDNIVHSGTVTQMPSVVINGKELELNIGEDVNADGDDSSADT